MKVKIISRENIKPSSPTPKSLKSFKLSLIDQFVYRTYNTMIFFYSSNGKVCFSERSQQLKKSLSKSLTSYYPLAGKLKDNTMIDCSDYGALYVEAQIDCSMAHFLEKPDKDELAKLIAIDIDSTEATKGGFFTLVQVSSFDCGGIAIGLSICHILCDATTLITFMKCWAAKMTLGSGVDEEAVVPLYNAATLFPSMKSSSFNTFDNKNEKLPKKRLVFEASKIAALKVAATSLSVDRPSRTEAVTSLIWKCALNAARLNSSSSRPSVLILVNLRKRTPYNSIGNLILHYVAQKDRSKVDLQALVCELREKIQLFDKDYMNLLQQEDISLALTKWFERERSMVMKPGIESYVCSSLCDIPLYDIDFGWRRPVWVTCQTPNFQMMMLIDTRKGDGSIEAWVTLTKEDMCLFERDPELLAYASLNPSVLHTVDVGSLDIKSSM